MSGIFEVFKGDVHRGRRRKIDGNRLPSQRIVRQCNDWAIGGVGKGNIACKPPMVVFCEVGRLQLRRSHWRNHRFPDIGMLSCTFR
jgi:hypothetical protein